MTHLELENLVSDYLEGLLEPARRAAVETHLAGCRECRELVGDVRRAMELCHAAEDLEPAPWLVSKIVRATLGERKPTFAQQVAAFFRPSAQPRVAYVVAMAIFSFSIIVNAAGINLRNLRAGDLNPLTWARRANSAGHLMYARAEKFYYDLRVVYEIESRFRQLRSQPDQSPPQAPKPEAPTGGSTDGKTLARPQLAMNRALFLAVSAPVETTSSHSPQTAGAGRSATQ